MPRKYGGDINRYTFKKPITVEENNIFDNSKDFNTNFIELFKYLKGKNNAIGTTAVINEGNLKTYLDKINGYINSKLLAANGNVDILNQMTTTLNAFFNNVKNDLNMYDQNVKPGIIDGIVNNLYDRIQTKINELNVNANINDIITANNYINFLINIYEYSKKTLDKLYNLINKIITDEKTNNYWLERQGIFMEFNKTNYGKFVYLNTDQINKPYPIVFLYKKQLGNSINIAKNKYIYNKPGGSQTKKRKTKKRKTKKRKNKYNLV